MSKGSWFFETDAKIRSFLVGGGRLRTIAEDCGGLWTICDTSGRILGGYGAANYVLIGAIRAIRALRPIRAIRVIGLIGPIRALRPIGPLSVIGLIGPIRAVRFGG